MDYYKNVLHLAGTANRPDFKEGKMVTLLETTLSLPGVSIVLSALVCIVGALMYALAANPKVSELGRLSFAVGLLSFLLLVK